MISEGLTTVEIAKKIYMSKRTVETHRMNVLEKTGSKNSAQLIKYVVTYVVIN